MKKVFLLMCALVCFQNVSFGAEPFPFNHDIVILDNFDRQVTNTYCVPQSSFFESRTQDDPVIVISSFHLFSRQAFMNRAYTQSYKDHDNAAQWRHIYLTLSELNQFSNQEIVIYLQQYRSNLYNRMIRNELFQFFYAFTPLQENPISLLNEDMTLSLDCKKMLARDFFLNYVKIENKLTESFEKKIVFLSSINAILNNLSADAAVRVGDALSFFPTDRHLIVRVSDALAAARGHASIVVADHAVLADHSADVLVADNAVAAVAVLADHSAEQRRSDTISRYRYSSIFFPAGLASIGLALTPHLPMEARIGGMAAVGLLSTLRFFKSRSMTNDEIRLNMFPGFFSSIATTVCAGALGAAAGFGLSRITPNSVGSLTSLFGASARVNSVSSSAVALKK